MGCSSDLAMGFHWMSRAVASGHPVVFQILQSLDLDVSEWCEGYRRSQQIWLKATDEHFGGVFDMLFKDSKGAIVPMPPSEPDAK